MTGGVSRVHAFENRTPPVREAAALARGSLSVTSGQFGLWAFLATVAMLLAGFTSAYLVRQTTGADWRPLPIPPILWLNTAVLLASSVTLERARRSVRREQPTPAKAWLLVSLLLGLLFLTGQLVGWRTLAGQGLFLPTNPHSSFFYVLTAVHGAHVLGGLAALAATFFPVSRDSSAPVVAHRLKLCATYWHFVDGAWLYLFLVLFVL